MKTATMLKSVLITLLIGLSLMVTKNGAAQVNADFTISSDTSGCTPLEVVVSNNTSGANLDTFIWDFGNGKMDTLPTLANDTVTYEQAGIYSIQLIATNQNGDVDSVTKIDAVKALESPDAKFNASDVCLGDTLYVDNKTEFSDTTLSYSWDFEGTSYDTSHPGHLFTSFGDKTITLTATDNISGCSGMAQATIEVKPRPISGFSFEQSFQDVNFTPENTDLNDYRWSFGDGTDTSFRVEPEHTYPDTGEYVVSLTVFGDNGCPETSTDTITVDSTTSIEALEAINAELINTTPNPFKEQTTIQYQLTNNADVKLSVFDASGQQVHQWDAGNQNAGEHRYQFDPQNFGYESGMFIIQLNVNGNLYSEKVLKLE